MATSRDKDGKHQAIDTIPARSGEHGRPAYRGESLATNEYGGWDPFRRIRDEFDQLLSQFFRGWPTEGDPAARRPPSQIWQWGLDMQEDDGTIRAEAPGFEPDDFDIQVRGNQMILRASHKSESKKENGGQLESLHQEFLRSVTLPTEVDAERVEANYRNGVLNLKLPKTQKSKARRIPVKA